MVNQLLVKKMAKKQKQNCIEKLIFGGEKIEKIILSRNSIAEIKFQDKTYSILDSNMTPGDLGKYMLAYWKFQRMNAGGDEVINPILVDNGLTETEFKNYKKKVVESICDLVGLPNNYSNKDKD